MTEQRLAGLCDDRSGCTLTVQRIDSDYVRLVHRYQNQLGIQITVRHPTGQALRRVMPRINFNAIDEKLQRDHEKFENE